MQRGQEAGPARMTGGAYWETANKTKTFKTNTHLQDRSEAEGILNRGPNTNVEVGVSLGELSDKG